jgi:hypothetical protein
MSLSPPPRRHLASQVEVLLFVVLALVFLVPGMNRGLIFDEYKTRMVADLAWADLFRERLAAGHLPTYFAMVKGWLAAVPYSNWAMRLPGMLFAAAGAIPFYYIGRRLAGPSGGRWVAFIYASNQLVIWAGQAARPYGPLLFFEGLTVLAVLQWWGSRRLRWLFFAGFASLGGIIMMPLAGLVTLSLIIGVTATWRRENTRQAWPLLLTLLLSLVVGFAPAVLVAASQSKLSTGGGGHTPEFEKIAEALATMVYGDYGLWARGFMQYMAEALFLGSMYFGLRRWSSLAKRASAGEVDPAEAGAGIPWRTWILFWIFTPLVALVLVSAFTGEAMVSHSRYQAPALGGVIVLLGIALTRARALVQNALMRNVITVIILAPLVITAVAWQRNAGEGGAVVAEQMITASGDQVPARVAGHVRWLRQELPRGQVPAHELFIERRPLRINEMLIAEAKKMGHDVEVIDYDKDAKDVTSVTQSLARWADSEPFWLFVYIQKKDGLDRIAQKPPAGYAVTRTVKEGFARAYYFSRI